MDVLWQSRMLVLGCVQFFYRDACETAFEYIDLALGGEASWQRLKVLLCELPRFLGWCVNRDERLCSFFRVLHQFTSWVACAEEMKDCFLFSCISLHLGSIIIKWFATSPRKTDQMMTL